jgi:hypothetical protein
VVDELHMRTHGMRFDCRCGCTLVALLLLGWSEPCDWGTGGGAQEGHSQNGGEASPHTDWLKRATSAVASSCCAVL